jgi:uncharacterized membrane protein YphA (DoxX/SURF4 family)
MKSKTLLWICRILAALILLQTLYFKFSGAPESVYIFSQVGMEPYGRIATGMAELVAAILILIPRTSLYGALLALILMVGAIGSHLFILGIEIMNDGGQLFIYAVIVTLACLFIIYKTVKPARAKS